MKYIIELTNKQKAQMDCMMEIVHRYIGFNPKLEPIKTTNVEDTNEYQIGYKTGYDKGFEDGNADATYNTDMIGELKQVEYIRGYNSAINDYNIMFKYMFHNIKEFRQFLLDSKYYDTEMVIRGSSTASVLFDLICDFDIAEVISEFQKWQEEKKKAEEIQVGDEVKDLNSGNIGVVMSRGKLIVYITNNGVHTNTLGSLEKTGRHFDEVEQLLDKMKE